MKLKLIGHDERYTVEQSLMNLLPGELPVYDEIGVADESWGVIELREGDPCRAAVTLHCRGKEASARMEDTLTGSDYEKEGRRRHLIARAFYKAAVAITGQTPPWGMLTGVRPDKLVTKALAGGKTEEEARAL